MSPKKKNNVSAKTALLLSSLMLFLCAVMLFVSVNLTRPDSPKENEKNQDEVKTEKNIADSSETPPLKTAKTDEKINRKKQPEIKPKKAPPSKTETKPAAKPDKTVPKIPAVHRGKIYIVLDDGGHNTAQLEPFLVLKFPLAIAVLPQLAHTEDCARKISASGKTLMLHQPMQAINLNVNPGPGAIKPEFTDQQIRKILEENYSQIAGNSTKKVAGMNNHEGSLITADERCMKIVMEFCRDKKIWFLDSRTNSQSICKKIAEQNGVKLYERNVFLDNKPDQNEMIKEFSRGVAIAEKNGSVILIGHVWSGKKLADVLEKMYSEYSSKGFEFVSF